MNTALLIIMDPFAVFDAPSADPFAVFDEPASASCAERNKRSCAQAALDTLASPLEALAAPLSTLASPLATPVLPLVRRFVAAHAARTCEELWGAPASATLSDDLDGAARALAASPPDYASCRAASERVSRAAWAELVSRKAWRPAWREAYVMAQFMTACASVAIDADTPAALNCLDRAFILGGPTDVYRDCAELLDVHAPPPAGPVPTPAAELPVATSREPTSGEASAAHRGPPLDHLT